MMIYFAGWEIEQRNPYNHAQIELESGEKASGSFSDGPGRSEAIVLDGRAAAGVGSGWSSGPGRKRMVRSGESSGS
jgi:hypothetical protein